jgi:YVTN family beta-propeller protein
VRHVARSLAVSLVVIGAVCSQTSPHEQPGKLTDGSTLLQTGWRLKPLGEQIPVDTLPMSSVLSRNGKMLLVLNAGANTSISVISTDEMKEKSRVRLEDAWLGLAPSPDGRFVYVGGGASYRVHEYSWSSTEIKFVRDLDINPSAKPGDRDFIGDVAVSPDGSTLYAADIFHDSIQVLSRQTGKVSRQIKTGRRPYRILFHPDGKSIFVSSWAESAIYQYDADSGNEMSRAFVGSHPSDMVLSDRKPDRDPDSGEKDFGVKYRLFVASANSNDIAVVGVTDREELKPLETFSVGFTSRQPAGMMPSGLAISPDQTRLYVACSGANAVAVADISQLRSHTIGFVPVNAYPTGVHVLSDNRLVALNGHGSSISVLPELTEELLDQSTRTVMGLSPYSDLLMDRAIPQPSPIQHVVYIIKEGRTYDQVLGNLGKGNGDPTLLQFDESVAPNHYKLAREFVLFDNFYVNGDGVAEGHNWATAAIAPSFTELLSPAFYANRWKSYPFEGGELANNPPAGYLWTSALSAGLTVRNYGEFVTNRKSPTADARQVDRVLDPALQSVTNMNYRGFDPEYADIERAKVFLGELKQFESSGTMPHLLVMRLANDRTAGGASGRLTPRAMVADNDAALGMIVEGVSKSRFWGQTAIFVTETDTRDGRDHVDSHRSIMFALSPFTHRAEIDSTMYNQSSVLRTIELLLALRPMTQFDAAAKTFNTAFAPAANPAPYTAEKPRVALDQRNPPPGAASTRDTQPANQAQRAIRSQFVR